jgi:hypothetical protein
VSSLARTFALVLLAALAGRPGATAAVEARAAPAAAVAEEHCFALVEAGVVVGACTERRHERGGVLTLERTYEWPRRGADPVVVRHVETRDSLGWRLSWRELSKDGASVHAERRLDGLLAWTAHDAAGASRGTLRRGRLRFPLEAAELARAGQGDSGAFELFEPTTRHASMVAWVEASSGAQRRLELVRADGLVVQSLRTRADGLQEFALQGGATEARAIAPRRLAALRERLGLPAAVASPARD